jgi:hypothetical protein
MNEDKATEDLALAKNLHLRSLLEDLGVSAKLSREIVKELLEKCGKQRMFLEDLQTLLLLLVAHLEKIAKTPLEIRQLFSLGQIPNQALLQLFATTSAPLEISKAISTGTTNGIVDLPSLSMRFLQVGSHLDDMEDHLKVVLRLVQTE